MIFEHGSDGTNVGTSDMWRQFNAPGITIGSIERGGHKSALALTLAITAVAATYHDRGKSRKEPNVALSTPGALDDTTELLSIGEALLETLLQDPHPGMFTLLPLDERSFNSNVIEAVNIANQSLGGATEGILVHMHPTSRANAAKKQQSTGTIEWREGVHEIARMNNLQLVKTPPRQKSAFAKTREKESPVEE